ncbi:hypothetical protein [Natrialba sp. INN-245]|uniref:HVO_0234 family beta-propeller protein n=1 Tax=Natrialba sp. INN-245 TaxID=2690967 RepID=UPI001312884F|nr:hypothetical protein [Natrialba sp. INN-245]MWV41674.1 hypothetical protein [Natrialba sp. INN-245]
MDSIEEKRVFGDRSGALEVYVASTIGVVRVRVAGDTVGEFGLCERCDTRDVAATADSVAIATDEDVRVLESETDTDDTGGSDGGFVDTGFGPAVAVGSDGTALLAADAEGRVARRSVDGAWTDLTDGLDATVEAIDGDFVATADGVYRAQDGRLADVGLTDARDVDAAGTPLVATGTGLFRLGNGWMTELEGAFEAVAVAPDGSPAHSRRAYAVSTDAVYAFDGEEWDEVASPDGRIVAVDYGETVYAVTEDGTFLAATDDAETNGWREHVLGVRGVAGLAAVSTRSSE